jgi:hypothetical protein
MSTLTWTELNIPAGGSPALELSLMTEAANKARDAETPAYGIIKPHARGWVMAVVVDGIYLFRPEVVESLQECAEALVLQMGSELDVIEAEERRQGNAGRAFSATRRSFRVVVPDRLRDTAQTLIEESFSDVSKAVVSAYPE